MLLVYEAFRFTEHSTCDRLQIRFRRYNHNLILRERRRVARKRHADSNEETVKPYAKQLLHSFDNIGGYSGVSWRLSYQFNIGQELCSHGVQVNGRATPKTNLVFCKEL